MSGGINASNINSSTTCSAFSFTASFLLAFTSETDCSTKSRIMPSTSLPTYPTSVNFDASTFTNGACAIFAKRLAISVLPTPVVPIIRILLGIISDRISSSAFIRLQRFLKAIATFFFASSWPMIYLSSSSTICLGVRLFSI